MKKLFFVFVILFLSAVVVHAQSKCNEGDKRDCGAYDEGECQFGLQYCEDGKWGFCIGQILPGDEICDDGKDNDCDGYVDEGCDCTFGESRKCGPANETGVCKFGIEYCAEIGEWSGECLNATTSSAEKCGPLNVGNSLDDDCDGTIDEGCSAPAQPSVPLSCTNRQKDLDETGIDCGGPCDACNTCDNGILEKDEKKIDVAIGGGKISDCGGLNCPQCPTCNDKVKNQGEEDIDCGGPCSVKCEDAGAADSDGDGLNLNVELQKGTNPNAYDTDNDGVSDSSDQLPLCPNSFCDSLRGENTETCPEDCQEEKGSGVVFIIAGILVLIILVALFFYLQFKKSSKNLGEKKTPWIGFGGSSEPYEKPTQPTRTTQRVYLRPASGNTRAKEKETDIEKKLRESIEKFGLK